MLKFLALALLFVSFSAHADAGDPTPDDCLKIFARDYVPEYNLENDYILSTDRAAVSGAIDVIKSSGFADWVVGFAQANLNKYTEAVGAVFNYGDEVHIIYTSINIEGGKCQVKEVADINTVDIEQSNDLTLLSKYFLNLPKTLLPPSTQEYLYDEVKNKLAGSDD